MQHIDDSFLDLLVAAVGLLSSWQTRVLFEKPLKHCPIQAKLICGAVHCFHLSSAIVTLEEGEIHFRSGNFLSIRH